MQVPFCITIHNLSFSCQHQRRQQSLAATKPRPPITPAMFLHLSPETSIMSIDSTITFGGDNVPG